MAHLIESISLVLSPKPYGRRCGTPSCPPCIFTGASRVGRRAKQDVKAELIDYTMNITTIIKLGFTLKPNAYRCSTPPLASGLVCWPKDEARLKAELIDYVMTNYSNY
jgi:hypothetical protein